MITISPHINFVYKYTVEDIHSTSCNKNSKKCWAYITSDLNSESQHATLKNSGSYYILMTFYLNKTKLFFSFVYNQFNHTRRSLCNEQLSKQLNANSSEYKKLCSTWESSRVIPCPANSKCQCWDLQATYFTTWRSLGHCYIQFAHPE